MTSNAQRQMALLLQSTMPAHESAWLAGYEAAQADLDEDENCFEVGEPEYTAWQSGWWAGFYNEPPLYELDSPAAALSGEQLDAMNDPEHAESSQVRGAYFGAKVSVFRRVLEVAGVVTVGAAVLALAVAE